MSLDRNKFAIFILTHGRPDNVHTTATLKGAGYTGRIYYIVDNEDKTVDQYREKFGAENVIVFDKKAIAETFDTADTQNDRRSIVYARNASFDIAKDLGLDYFLQLDDDYTTFLYRYTLNDVIYSTHIRQMDKVLAAMIELLESSDALTVAMSQGGDYIGGAFGGNNKRGLLRKAMNSFIFRTNRPAHFVGRINEDVNTYVSRGSRGELFFTAMSLMLTQKQTQQSSGGMTELYLAAGTYTKSFYTVMMAPSCVKIGTMGPVHRRFHHSIKWDYAVPKIVSSRHRKLLEG